MAMSIDFGLSGWTGRIARDFTFENARVVAQAIADYLRNEQAKPNSPLSSLGRVVVIGHDTRFLGREFSQATAEILSANGFKPLLCEGAAPTAVISHAVRTKRASAGINFSACRKSAEYQRLRLSTHCGAAAGAEITENIQKQIQHLQSAEWRPKAGWVGSRECQTFDPKPSYAQQIKKLIDFQTIKKANLKVAVDLSCGAGRGYLDELLEQAGARVVRFNSEPNPLFGGREPDPTAENMREVREFIMSGHAVLGLGVDCDADRFGIVDKDGAWLCPNQVMALGLYHLKKNRGWTGAVVRTVTTSHQIDAVARWLGVEVHETQAGFKDIAALVQIEPIILGGEESGGLTVKGHLPEKDGILACLLMAELVAAERRSLGSILQELAAQLGDFYTDKLNIPASAEKKQALLSKLASSPDKIGPFRVEKIIDSDGFKYILANGEWVAFRASGTEPLLRCYIEAKSIPQLRRLRSACQKFAEV